MISKKVDGIYLNDFTIVTGPTEKMGILHESIDYYYDDLYHLEKTFEKAEITLIRKTIELYLVKYNKKISDFDIIIYSELSNQLALSSYALSKYDIPAIGIYSACSGFSHSLIEAVNYLNNGCNNVLISLTSHNAISEKTFRFPLEYGQNYLTSSSLTTSASVCLNVSRIRSNIKLTSYTIGKITISDINDSKDIGRTMAKACFNTLISHLRSLSLKEDYYDLVVTGDLGKYGKKLFEEYLKKDKIMINNLMDCGDIIYKAYDMKDEKKLNKIRLSGGSGIGCVSSVVLGYITKLMKEGIYKKVLVLASGSLHSKILTDQKIDIPSISHAIALEVENGNS